MLDAPREDAWDAIWDAERWPEWWPDVREAVETDPGTPCGVGRRGRYTWRGTIPYAVRLEALATEVERPSLLAGEVTGALEGTGIWRFDEREGVTTVLYEWRVRIRGPWMSAADRVAAPILRWNHDAIMRRGGEGLARHLGCRLLGIS